MTSVPKIPGAIFHLLPLCAILLGGCLGEREEASPQNPLLAIDIEAIHEVRFVGTSSPIPGDHFKSAARELIESVYSQASSLRKRDPAHITMPGNITMIQFFGDEDALLAEVSVGGDGETVVLHDPGDARKTLVVPSRDFCLYVFELLKTHAVHVLQEMLTLDDRGNRELHLKAYPFDQIRPEAAPPSSQK